MIAQTGDHRVVPVCTCVLLHLATAIRHYEEAEIAAHAEGYSACSGDSVWTAEHEALEEVRAAWNGFVGVPNPSAVQELPLQQLLRRIATTSA